MLTAKQIESVGLRVTSCYVDGNGGEIFTFEAIEDPDLLVNLIKFLSTAEIYNKLKGGGKMIFAGNGLKDNSPASLPDCLLYRPEKTAFEKAALWMWEEPDFMLEEFLRVMRDMANLEEFLRVTKIWEDYKKRG